MILNAIVIGSDVQRGKFYDQMTGAQKPSFSINLTVLDADTHEKYECQLNEGFPALDELKEYGRQGQPDAVIEQAVDTLRAQLPPQMATLQLEVLRFKGKQAAFIKLVCRFVRVAAATA